MKNASRSSKVKFPHIATGTGTAPLGAIVFCALLSSCSISLSERLEYWKEAGDSQLVIVQTDLPNALSVSPHPAASATELQQEYQGDYSKDMIHAASAYAEGLSGAGIRVAMLDSGLPAVPHPELPRSRVTSSIYLDGLDATGEPIGKHGVAVAGMLAAARDGVGMHGIAPSAQLLMRRADVAEFGGGYPLTLEQLQQNDALFAQHFDWAVSTASIVNNSWGVSGGIELLGADGEPIYTEIGLRNALPATIAALAQADKPAAERTIFVWSAGNEASQLELAPTSPQLMSALPVRIAELRGHWLVVTAVGADGSIADFANRCGEASDFCLAAPGEEVKVPLVPHNYPASQQAYTEGGALYGLMSGTSFAAPIVSGALALMMEKFPLMPHTDLVARLLATANKTGVYEREDLYGQGLLNLHDALTPQGGMSLYLNAAGSQLLPLHAGAVAVGEGRALFSVQTAPVLVHQEILAMDSLGTPFRQHAKQYFADVPTQVSPLLPPHLQAAEFGVEQGNLSLAGGSGAGSWLTLRRKIGSLQVFLQTGAPPLAGGFKASHLSPISPWLAPSSAALGDTDGGGISLHSGNSRFAVALFRHYRDATATNRALPAVPDASHQAWLLDYRLSSGATSWQFQAGRIDETGSVLGLQLPILAGLTGAGSDWLGIIWGQALAHNWRLQLAFYLARSEVEKSPQTVLLQSLTLRPDGAPALVLSGHSLLADGDGLYLQLGTSTGALSGDAEWRLPLAMSQGKVQFATVSSPLRVSPNRYADLHYRLRLGSLSLALHLGHGGAWGDAQRPPEGWTAVSLRLPL